MLILNILHVSESKQAVKALLPSARQQVWLLRVHEDHHFRRMSRVIIDVALALLSGHKRHVKGQKLQSFTGIGDVFIWVKILEWDVRVKQTNKQTFFIET